MLPVSSTGKLPPLILKRLQQDNPLLKLDGKFHLIIFNHLDVKSLIQVGRSCRLFRILHTDAAIWREVCMQHVFPHLSVPVNIPTNADYKEYGRIFRPALRKPFPGKSAVFKREGDWTPYDPLRRGVQLLRSLDFVSHTEGSFLVSFSVLGYRGGQVHLAWKLSERVTEFKQYFQSVDLVTEDFDESYKQIIFRNPVHVLKAFLILAKFNEIPEKDLPLIEKLVLEADWTKVTPLTKKDYHRFAKQRSAIALMDDYGLAD